MLLYSLEAPHRGASNEYPQHMFLWRSKKNIMQIPPVICSYVEKKKKKKHLGLAKAGLKSGVVLFLSGLNSGLNREILLYFKMAPAALASGHYENMRIQIYKKVHLRKLKLF